MDKFTMPTRIMMGEGALSSIADLGIRRAFIVCDPFMKESGMVEKITDLLKKTGADFDIFAEVRPDPDLSIVTKGLEQAVYFGPDAIISMGGGSSIDVAKALDCLYRRYKPSVSMCTVAIPTTSGTGSEVTSATVVTNREEKVKIPFADPDIVPQIAILDPELTLSVPPSVTADTGMDAFTHALEAFVATGHNDFTDAGGEKAMRLIWEYLEKAVKDGKDREARMHLQTASTLAGAAFSIAGVGICHSMAHALGERFHIAHGKANAMLLPFAIFYNAGIGEEGEFPAAGRYALAAKILGIEEETEEASVCRLIQQIGALERRIGIPRYVSDLKISREEFLAAIDEMSRHAWKDPCNDTNPRKPSLEDIKNIFRSFCG